MKDGTAPLLPPAVSRRVAVHLDCAVGCDGVVTRLSSLLDVQARAGGARRLLAGGVGDEDEGSVVAARQRAGRPHRPLRGPAGRQERRRPRAARCGDEAPRAVSSASIGGRCVRTSATATWARPWSSEAVPHRLTSLPPRWTTWVSLASGGRSIVGLVFGAGCRAGTGCGPIGARFWIFSPMIGTPSLQVPM